MLRLAYHQYPEQMPRRCRTPELGQYPERWALALGPDQNCPAYPLTTDFFLGTSHLLPHVPILGTMPGESTTQEK